MAYYTRTECWPPLRQRNLKVKSVPQLVVHDECLPDDQFESWQLSSGPHRHQTNGWCWSRIYGGSHDCWYCGEKVA